jgi:hypothetical protein
MNLDTFNQLQHILAQRTFDEIAGMIYTFKTQVQTQLVEMERQRQQSPQPVSRLHLAPDGAAE